MQQNNEPGKRTMRVKEVVQDRPGGWAAFLTSLAEHPGMSARNLATIAEYRMDAGHKGYLDILSFAEAQRPYSFIDETGSIVSRHGTVIAGEKAVLTLRVPDGNGNFNSIGYFLPSQCYGLDKGRFTGRPLSISTSDEHLKMFMEAAAEAELDDADAETAFVVYLRYGAASVENGLPPSPGAGNVWYLCDALDQLSERVKEISLKIDTGLARIRAERAAALEGAALAASRDEPANPIGAARDARRRNAGTRMAQPVYTS